MSSHDKHQPMMATERIQGRPRRLLVSTSKAVICGSLLLAILLGAWLLRARREDDVGSRFPPGILADYVPEDSAAVVNVNVGQLREASIGRPYLRSFLQDLIRTAERHLSWLEPAGINPLDDFDTLLISFPSEGGGGSVLLARGRFDRARFQIGPDKLQAKLVDHFSVWEHSGRFTNQTTLLALIGDTLVVSGTRSRVHAALRQARIPQPNLVRDPILSRLLRDVDRQQCLWLAASMRHLGPVSEIDDYLLRMILRPLLTHAESVYGGIAYADDLQVELQFVAASVEDAAQLEADLKSICEAAPGAALLGRQGGLLPLLRLLASGQIRAEGNTILLHCRLTANQLEK